MDRDGVCARQDGEIWVSSSIDRGLDLCHELVGWDHALAGNVPATRRRDPVFQHQRRCTSLFELLHGPTDLGNISMTIVAVSKDR